MSDDRGTCPDCNADVSSKALSCPKCGCPLGYPEFYTEVSRGGLDLQNLLADYERKCHNDLSALADCNPMSCLLSRYGNVSATREQLLLIRDDIDRRLNQIHFKSAEYRELVLLKRFMEVVLGACNAAKANDVHANLPYAIQELEVCLSRCQSQDDSEFIEMAINSCRVVLR